MPGRGPLGTWCLRAATLAALCCGPVRAEPADAAWCRYRSGAFDLVTSLEPARAHDLLAQLERFQQAALTLLDVPAPTQRVRVTVFEERADFAALFSPGRKDAFMQPALDGHRLVGAPGADDGRLEPGIFYEHAHLLQRGPQAQSLPLWYAEGVAGLLSNAQVADDVVKIGALPDDVLAAAAGLTPEGLSRLLSRYTR